MSSRSRRRLHCRMGSPRRIVGTSRTGGSESMNRWRLSLLFQIACAAVAGAQATPIVRPTARVYRDIERLGALGLIDTLLLGVRPWSEREITRLLREAQANLARKPAARAWAEQTIRVDL